MTKLPTMTMTKPDKINVPTAKLAYRLRVSWVDSSSGKAKPLRLATHHIGSTWAECSSAN
jgi:hypothetical protein